MTKRIAVFSLDFRSFDSDAPAKVFVRLPIDVGPYVSVSDACEALADKLGLEFYYTEDLPEEN